MKFLTLQILSQIHREVSELFDSLATNFIGFNPKNKRISLKNAPTNSLVSLFIQSLGNRKPTRKEAEQFKIMSTKSAGFISALKDKTKANLATTMQDLLNKEADSELISKEIGQQFEKAKNHFKLIVDSESHAIKNFGTAFQIEKVANSLKDEDPIVFFNVIIDERNDPETYRLHLLPDRQTPRLWKLSELGHDYHKKGDSNPKIMGTNPNCRCKLTYLPPGFGFDEGGKLIYKSKDWDEFRSQRDKFGKP